METISKLKLSDLTVNEARNFRVDYGDIESLKEFIRNNGIPGYLEAFRDASGGIILSDGFRRCRAVKLLQSGGECLELELPVIIRAEMENPELDSLYTQITRNGGKEFTVLEQGALFQEMEIKGESIQDISRKSGKSVQWVKDCISLMYSGSEVLEAVETGEISGTKAIKAVKSIKNISPDGITPEKIVSKAKESKVAQVPAKIKDTLLELYQITGSEWVNTLLDCLEGNISVHAVASGIKQEVN